MDALTVEEQDPATERLHAVFAAFIFRDDVDVWVQPDGDGAVLHIRSASRVGHSDLGVNGRRVGRFWKTLEATLQAT